MRGPAALACAAVCAAVLAASLVPAAAAPGEKQFTVIVSHDQNRFLTAMRAGADFVKRGGRQYRIVLATAGAIVAIPGSSTVQRDYMKMSRPRGLEVVVCKETMQALERANKRRIPVLPGMSVQSCNGLRNKMILGGWQVAPGI